MHALEDLRTREKPTANRMDHAAKNTIQTQFYYIFMMVIILSYAVIPVLFQSILIAFLMGVVLQPFSVQSAKRRGKV